METATTEPPFRRARPRSAPERSNDPIARRRDDGFRDRRSARVSFSQQLLRQVAVLPDSCPRSVRSGGESPRRKALLQVEELYRRWDCQEFSRFWNGKTPCPDC